MASLSKLPTDIIDHIFSYLRLNNKKAIQLSRLSKELHNIVQRRPALVFDHENYSEEEASDSKYQIRCREEVNYLASTLDRYHKENIHLETFSFKAAYSVNLPKECDILTRLIRFSIQKGIKNLNLSLPPSSEKYVVPQFVFEAESLVELSLKFCTLSHPEGGRVAWQNLKRLHLHHVDFGDNEVFEDIIRGTDSLLLIECLEIDLCFGPKHSIFNLFTSACNGKNLERLKIKLISSNTIGWNAFQKFKNLKCITLEVKARIDDSIFPNLPRLEELDIQDYANKTLNVSSLSLKKIRLMGSEILEEARFDVPSILHFDYKMSTYDAIPQISFRGNLRGWVSCLKFDVSKQSGFFKMKHFLAEVLSKNTTSSESQLTINWNGNEVQFLDDLDLITFPAGRIIPGIGDIYISASSWSTFSLPRARSILISIFRICRPEGRVTFLWKGSTNWQCVSGFFAHHLWNVTLPHYLHDKLLELLRDDKEMKMIKLEYWTSCPDIPPPVKRLKLN